MTNLRDNPAEVMRHLEETRRPVVLTVDGRAAAVLQDAEGYQRLLDLAAAADATEGIRQGLEDLEAGRVMPVSEAFRLARGPSDVPG